ncbi:MAG: hypothetical protein A3I66_11630 [Burkholderiales bacterium RIFCSPLOWO2_02_FULL_57_36]|nr:MAG: hypothetical protein A3I66_11630 [Burkholderiales bacterium RIFCSPLOWO2_02_FULL_57_36]
MELSLKNVLSLYGLQDFQTTKVVRHKDRRLELATGAGLFELLERRINGKPLIEWYQSIQSKNVFKACERIISFYSNYHAQTVLLGVFTCRGFAGGDLPPRLPHPIFYEDAHFHYDLERDARFSDLENRLVIEWGESHINWHQHLHNKDKAVLEILPIGYLMPFPGFDRVMLTFAQLRYLVQHEMGNREWVQRLAGVNGIYLITDQKDSEQYVGAAYGESSDVGGIWGRWRQYATTNGTGGNLGLTEKLLKCPDKAHDLLFSILQITDKSSRTAVLKLEQTWKEKLGTHVHGLNR